MPMKAKSALHTSGWIYTFTSSSRRNLSNSDEELAPLSILSLSDFGPSEICSCSDKSGGRCMPGEPVDDIKGNKDFSSKGH